MSKIALVFSFALAAPVAAPLAAQHAPPIRLIAAPVAASAPVFGAATAVRALPHGALLVNDPVHRQLVLLDSTLTHVTVVADSASGAANAYGPRPGGLIAYVGDSSLFVDPSAVSMLVIGPNGAIARVASVPRSQDASFLVAPGAAFDAQHRLVYRAIVFPKFMAASSAAGSPPVPDLPDSSLIVGVDLATRKLDTIASYKIAKPKMTVNQADGRVTVTTEINPLAVSDDWAVLSDGSIAIVRAQDVHIDWINADGTRSATPKIPFDWQHLSDDDKVAIVDSAKAAIDRQRAAAASGGASADAMITTMTRARVSGAVVGGGPVMMTMGSAPPPSITSPADLPDYRPAFSPGGVKADLDDNLWIRTSQIRPNATSAGTVYDVVNRQGELVDRIEIPAGRVIVGFGKGGVVYMAARDDHGTWIEETHR